MFYRLNRIEDFYYIKENKFVSSFFKKPKKADFIVFIQGIDRAVY
ncbi:hypothetical protein JCM2421_01300 [Staphylococcus auricularis]|nr:hypothetical protein JCM2421_01300 [Staphylococcus auricularis]